MRNWATSGRAVGGPSPGGQAYPKVAHSRCRWSEPVAHAGHQWPAQRGGITVTATLAEAGRLPLWGAVP